MYIYLATTSINPHPILIQFLNLSCRAILVAYSIVFNSAKFRRSLKKNEMWSIIQIIDFHQKVMKMCLPNDLSNWISSAIIVYSAKWPLQLNKLVYNCVQKVFSSFLTYYQVYNKRNICGTGNAYPSGALEFTSCL